MRGKAEAVVKAATMIFLNRGFAAANMDDIAAEAGVSKRTVYKHFESKENLFATIISQASFPLVDTLDVSQWRRKSPHATLKELAQNYLRLILSIEALETYRLVVAESARFPELTASFHANGAVKVSRALATYLAEWHAIGAINVPDPEIAADQFMGSCAGSLRLRALFEKNPPVDARTMEFWVDRAVERFLTGVGYKPDQA